MVAPPGLSEVERAVYIEDRETKADGDVEVQDAVGSRLDDHERQIGGKSKRASDAI
jgi:hypothetical protein